MADLQGIRPYAALEQHYAEMRQSIRQRRYRVAIAILVGAAATVAGYWILPPLAILIAGVAVLTVFFSALTSSSSVHHSALSGAEGEQRVLRELADLPDDYRVFNQVSIPDPSVAGGKREIDFIVLAPSGIYLIEVKNTAGLIVVRPAQKQWPLAHKAGCGGRPGWNAIANPLIQLTAQTDAVNRWLLHHGVLTEVQPILCFARSESGVRDREEASIPIVLVEELGDFFARAPRRRWPEENIVRRLLSAGAAPGETPQIHGGYW